MMMNVNFTLPFDFSVIAAGSSSTVAQEVYQGNFLVHGISTFNADSNALAARYAYNIQLIDYRRSIKLSDEPIWSGTFEASINNFFELPSPLYIPRGTILNLTLTNDSVSTVSLTVQICLVGEMVESPPLLSRKPFIYSFTRNLGFADYFNNSAVTIGPDRTTGGVLAKPPLDTDFELIAITMDDQTRITLTGFVPIYSIQVFGRLNKKKFLNVPALSYNVAGHRIYEVFRTTGVPSDLTTYNKDVRQYRLPSPVRFEKGDQMRVQILMVPIYLTSANVHSVMTQDNLNVALIGNKILEG